MHRPLNFILFVIAASLVALDATWIMAGHFTIDARNYGLLAFMIAPLFGAAVYYGHHRNEAEIGATLSVSAFLIVLPAAASLLSYLLTSIAGPRIDNLLASADLALGFHWDRVMALAADHPQINAVLAFAYISVMPQTVVLILVLGLRGRLEALYGLALALSLGALITLAIWTAFPSFGAFSVFVLPDPVVKKLGLVLGFDYARELVAMLRSGPGFITPTELRGIVGFPSYHTLQAIVLLWYAWREPWLRGVAAALNFAVLLAIPIQGGHHLMDMFGGALVAVASIALSARLVAWAQHLAKRTPRAFQLPEPVHAAE